MKLTVKCVRVSAFVAGSALHLAGCGDAVGANDEGPGAKRDESGASDGAVSDGPADDDSGPNSDTGEPSGADGAGDESPGSSSNPSPNTPGADSPGTSQDLGDESGPGALPEGTDPGGVDVACDASEPGVSPLMKLSTVQYRNTVRDLLEAANMGGVVADTDAALSSIPADTLVDSFRGLDERVSMEHVQGYLDVGKAVGDALAADPSALESAIGSCALDTELSDGCAQDFLETFLPLVYRRPVDSDEIAAYIELNDGQRSPAEAVRAMIVVALSSPRFVNHLEIDGTASSSSTDILQLTSYEIASRLSYTFWQTMPDAELFAAADDGSLATEGGFQEQLDRIFDDPRTRQTLWQFWNEWMKLERFTGFETARPAFIALTQDTNVGEDGHDYYGDMVQEIRELTEVLTFERDATVADLLLTDISVTQSDDLAALYGVEPYSGSGDYPRLPEGTRVGLFQRAAILVSNLEQTNPFHRGAFVRRALLCDDLPQPDPNSLPPGSLDPPAVDGAQTTRQRFEAKVDGNSLCEGCHGAFSDIGYVLESFDALGRHRTTEFVFDEQSGELLAELPLDTSAVARVDLDDETEVSDAVDLAQRMVESQKVEACLAQNYFEYSVRRLAEGGSADGCMVGDLAALLADPEQGLRAAFRRVAQYDGFFQRKVGPR